MAIPEELELDLPLLEELLEEPEVLLEELEELLDELEEEDEVEELELLVDFPPELELLDVVPLELVVLLDELDGGAIPPIGSTPSQALSASKQESKYIG